MPSIESPTRSERELSPDRSRTCCWPTFANPRTSTSAIVVSEGDSRAPDCSAPGNTKGSVRSGYAGTKATALAADACGRVDSPATAEEGDDATVLTADRSDSIVSGLTPHPATESSTTVTTQAEDFRVFIPGSVPTGCDKFAICPPSLVPWASASDESLSLASNIPVALITVVMNLAGSSTG